jgi:hypothetical protein
MDNTIKNLHEIKTCKGCIHLRLKKCLKYPAMIDFISCIDYK